jgi:hypothetical protein
MKQRDFKRKSLLPHVSGLPAGKGSNPSPEPAGFFDLATFPKDKSNEENSSTRLLFPACQPKKKSKNSREFFFFSRF